MGTLLLVVGFALDLIGGGVAPTCIRQNDQLVCGFHCTSNLYHGGVRADARGNVRVDTEPGGLLGSAARCAADHAVRATICRSRRASPASTAPRAATTAQQTGDQVGCAVDAVRRLRHALRRLALLGSGAGGALGDGGARRAHAARSASARSTRSRAATRASRRSRTRAARRRRGGAAAQLRCDRLLGSSVHALRRRTASSSSAFAR